MQRQLRDIRSGRSRQGKSEVKKFTMLDLQPYANQKLNESMGSGSRPANTLASLPAGRQCTAMELAFPAKDGKPARVRRAVLGPVAHFMQEPLKVLNSGLGLTPRAVQRFRREAEAAAKLHHTNIVPVYATGEEKGSHFYAMELIEGPSLDRVSKAA